MFTGIVEEMGSIVSVARGSRSAVLTVKADKVLKGSRVGDSIAVNGVCLTVTAIMAGQFTADVMAETLRRSSLGSLTRGSLVNLERAMAADGRFGGHIVAGHIDGTGTILSLTPEDNAVWVEIKTDQNILKYVIEKGSVAIDGISLTVARVGEQSFAVSVIPHTGTETTLLRKKAGDIVNLENDVIGKYVERLLHTGAGAESAEGKTGRESSITMDFLIKNGY